MSEEGDLKNEEEKKISIKWYQVQYIVLFYTCLYRCGIHLGAGRIVD